ncbi:MAG TPA: putative PEP-binding protein, partial [bacterium]|nr:putative PEP-binding protein [bacterium]
MDPEEILGSFSLPEELGSIEESYRPDSEAGPGFRPLIFYIQDAHANEDSGNHISGIIRHLEEKYGLPLVLLEGGEGKLDSLFFKSFPDRKLKEKVLANYLRDGELSGGEAASIQSDFKTADYFGIEDQVMYRKNKKCFLESFERKDQNEAFLKKIRSELWVKASRYFSQDVRTYQEMYEAFHNESLDLLTYAKQIKDIYTKTESATAFSASFSALQQLILAGENENPSGEKYEIALARLIAEVQAEFLPSLPNEEQKKWGAFIQNVRTTRSRLPEFIKAIEQNPKAGSITIPSILSSVSKSHQTLSSIEGTDIFTELHALEETLRKKLPRSAQEKALLQDFYDLGLMERLNRLEINRKEWNEIQSMMSKPRVKSVWRELSLWENHLKFYQLAAQRDEILFRNMMDIARQKKAQIAVLVTGGFHGEGLTDRFKKGHIPYIRVTPRIEHLGTQDNYFRVMNGKASYMKFYQGSLWYALAEDYALKLTNLLAPQDRFIYLKRWRDGIIQGAIREGRVEEAGNYTVYIDRLRQSLKEESELGFGKARDAEIRRKLKIFGAGLKEMWKTGEITPESLGQLVRRMNAGPLSTLSAEIALIRSSHFEFIPRSEVRAAPLPEDQASRKEEAPQFLTPDEKLERVKALLVQEIPRRHFKEYFSGMTEDFPRRRLKESTVESIADLMRFVYSLFAQNISQPGQPIQAGSYNPVLPDAFQQRLYVKNTELIVVSQDREGLDRDITTVIAGADANIEKSYTATVRLHQSGQKIIVFIFEINRGKQPLSETQLTEIISEIEKIPPAGEQERKELRFKTIPRSGGIVMGEVAILRELPGGIADVAYDIFAGLRGSPGDEENGDQIAKIMQEDHDGFRKTINRIIDQETFLPSVFVRSQNGMTNRVVDFVKELSSETLDRASKLLDPDNPHRQSALSIFLDIVQGKIEEAQNASNPIAGLTIEEVQKIEALVINELRHKYRLFSPEDPERAQIDAIERQVAKFEKALAEAIDTKGADAETLARLTGIKSYIDEKEGGIRNAVIEKIQNEGVNAPYAIAEVVIPKIKELEKGGGKKQHANAKDLRKIFKNVVRLLNEKGIQGEFITGVKTGNDLVLFARHPDPFEILRLVQEFPEITAIVSDESSYSAHWALVAENLGIRVLILESFQTVGLDIMDRSLVGSSVIADSSGQLIINPSEKTRELFEERLKSQTLTHYIDRYHAWEKAETLSGQQIHVLANADSAEEINDAMDNGAEGVGLVRTEYLFDEDNDLLKEYLKEPTEANRNALVGYFEDIFSDMALYTRRGSLTIRMFDLERDKKSFLDQPDYNPEKAYGLEYYWTDIGQRLLAIELEAAVRANLESARGHIRILFPMNQAPEDLAKKLRGRKDLIGLKPEEQQLLNEIAIMDVNYLNDRLDEVIATIRENTTSRVSDEVLREKVEKIQRGFMIETQESLNILPHVLERADYVSIGTNDLTLSLFRDLRRFHLPKFAIPLREKFPAMYKLLHGVYTKILRSVGSLLIQKAIPLKDFVWLLTYILPSTTGISRDAIEDAQYFQELQPRVMEAVKKVLEQVTDKNASLERLESAKKIPICICGALAGVNEFALYMTHAPPAHTSIELSTSGWRIPALKQFIRAVHTLDTSFLRNQDPRRFNLHQELAQRAAVLTAKQHQKATQEYEEMEQLRQIQEVQFPPLHEGVQYEEV